MDSPSGEDGKEGASLVKGGDGTDTEGVEVDDTKMVDYWFDFSFSFL